MAAGNGNFTGTISLTVLEASGLKPVTLPGGFQLVSTAMDPYLVVDVDDVFFSKTNPKTKTPCPVWNETCEEDVEDAEVMQMTVFHKSTIPPHPFIAHVQFTLSELNNSVDDEFVVSHTSYNVVHT